MELKKQTVRMDAADGSFYKGTIMEFAEGGKVSVKQVDEDLYEFSWVGPSWNEIADIMNERES